MGCRIVTRPLFLSARVGGVWAQDHTYTCNSVGVQCDCSLVSRPRGRRINGLGTRLSGIGGIDGQ